MTKLHISTPNKGLHIGTQAPVIETEDIDGDSVNSIKLLEKHKGVLLDFFRGSW
ncbi:hypothetical protein LCGC14_0778090 [marine sediment metagenome]|uniref:Redoxin domain-containing protein n=1 Tax=marine sediment metagenome TaxID=412755 RepID=A0A0F9SG73_9ZZZZ|nr:MAG: hypothetical protein Lokiarch_32560 [Candidatus Lokiarchaeum sp. GC14_75]